jgi:Tfp pilus assembly protein PilV
MKLRDIKRERRGADGTAFTLMEVMIAVAIFFMAMFSILSVLSSALHAATMLRTNGPTAGMRASELTLTNKMEEGSDSGTFGDIPIYDGYRWTSQTTEVATNGLFQVDFAVYNSQGVVESTLTCLFYRPDSDSGHMGLQ